MARLRDIVFDCHHPASLARFWAAALDGYEVAPYDEEELERLRNLGFSGPEDDPSVLVEAGSGPRLFFNLVPEGKVAKNRVHLDLTGDDVERLVGLGAKVLACPEDGLVVLADPEGNEFCLVTRQVSLRPA
ncbi:VOC family protein [Amycolatopsis sp. lyj-112]|uniref:VOC family protein n=1 Tax=Amycolatopsis sp. lyj-112 TaxID=2789288 RepID=UPI00397C1B41